MAKITLADVVSFANDVAAVLTGKQNNDRIEAALENTLSRDGTSPNTMTAPLDMNGQKILNHPIPTLDTDVATFGAIKTSETSASASAVAAAADAVSTAADKVSTNADAAATALDKIATNADAIATAADKVSTAADAAATALDKIDTNADVVTTNADVVTTTADKASATASAAAASTSESNAGTSETNAASSASAASTDAAAASDAKTAAENADGFRFTFDSGTAMADPGTGGFRFNNATIASVTAIAVDALTADVGNPDVSDYLAQWGASSGTNKGTIVIRKNGTPATFAVFNITATVVDNTGWLQITVTHVASAGTWTAADIAVLKFARAGDMGLGVGDMLAANNLSDVANAATSATNLGLGTGDSPTHVGLTLSAALVTTSTVDGRDVSVDGTKLDGVEAAATADQTGAQIKSAYEVESNAYTDTKNTKLAGIATGAEVNPPPISQVDAEAGTATIEETFTAQRVKQAIVANSQADLAVPSQAEAEAGTATTERVWTAERVGQGAQVGSINVRIDGADGTGIETTEVQAGINRAVAAGKPLVLPDPVYTTGALNTVGAMLSSRTMFYSDARGLVETLDKIDVDTAAALTHVNEDFVFSYRNSNLSGNDVYKPIFPNINHYDVVQGVCDIVTGGTIEHATGIAGYIKNLDATVNGVCLFGAGYVDVNNGNIWGINTLLQDDAVRSAGTDTGRGLFNEFDFNVMHSDTQVIGLSVGGNSLAQPTNAIGFNCATLGTGFKWITAFNSLAGASINALVADTRAVSGNNIESQKILFVSTDSGGTRRSAVLKVQAGNTLILTGATKFKLKIDAENILLDPGHSFIVNGIPVLSDRKIGWTAATGTATRTTFVTSTVTTALLAERVKALIDDLIAHGIIGI